MKRREFLALGSALTCGGLGHALGQEASAAPGGRAIAEGGPLKPPESGLVRVAIAVSASTTWIDFVGPQAAFETFYQDPADQKYKPRFQMSLVSESTAPVGGLVPDHTFQDAPRAHIVLVPAQRGSPALLDWLRKSVETADIVMSVCTGALHLARAGLLDGRQATTHHKAIEPFARQFPAVKWVAGVRFVEGPKISTGGGLTAGIDLALRVVERYYGREWAQEVADHLEYQGRGWIV